VKTEESAYVFQTIPNNIANEHLWLCAEIFIASLSSTE
jgi:hypothetical protein